MYDDFYVQLVRVKNIESPPFADNAQQLWVKYICEDLGQQWVANGMKGTGPVHSDDTAWHMLDIPGATSTWALRLTGVT